MKTVLVCGTRPNFMKVAPLMRAIDTHNSSPGGAVDIHPVLVHTGQHYDYEMSKVFFKDLGLREPDLYLGVGSATHAEQTGKVMVEVERVLARERPDVCVVVGDVNSTLAAALAAVKLHFPIAHVEAGQRSYDRRMPEEINRLLTDAISDHLFAATTQACENLAKEGIPPERVHFVGDIMVDSLLYCRPKAGASEVLSQLGLERGRYAVLTLHRPDNVDDKERLTGLLTAMGQVAQRVPIVFPVHPRTRKNISAFGLDSFVHDRVPQGAASRSGLYATQPLGYLDFLCLMMNSRLVLTDSGGIQAETTVLGVPCLTVYPTTDWLITLTEGTNILVGVEPDAVVREANLVLDGTTKSGRVPALWDGRTSERIVRILTER